MEATRYLDPLVNLLCVGLFVAHMRKFMAAAMQMNVHIHLHDCTIWLWQ